MIPPASSYQIFIKGKTNLHTTSTIQSFLEQATETERNLLETFVNGLEEKRQGRYTTFVNAAFQFDISFPDETCRVEMPITPLTVNSFGMPHGGIVATLIDNAMGFLVNKDLRPQGKGAVTTNLTIHYTKATTEPSVYSIASYLHKGRQTLVLEASAYDAKGTRIAYATGSFFVIDLPTQK